MSHDVQICISGPSLSPELIYSTACRVFSLAFVIVAVQLLSRVRLFAIPCTAAHQASLSLTISRSLLKLMSLESMMPSSHLIFCCPLLFLFSVFPSNRIFSSQWAVPVWWRKYWSFSISPSNEYSGLISCRIVWSCCSPRDSQESSLAPQFESISSLPLSLFTSLLVFLIDI